MDIEGNIERITETGCWIWMGWTTKARPNAPEYAVVRLDGKPVRVHRLLLQQEGGTVQAGKLACHRCGVSLCVNPHHLYSGTVTENNRDTVAMGRHKFGGSGVPPIGERHWAAKLDWNRVREIRTAVGPNTEIAKRFNVSRVTVSRIRNGHLWKE
ncbi:Uncharacterised protein [Burkholderia pseudomallei]|uniref:HNH endonuclease n=1 Tax=Burkholderia pseudomallei TaxID=28450 RepID=UPI0005E93963|nr:HNH endonuclease [Burkholderia pseudomallei]CAJ2719979.1 Uncharacterised protein [Burkholderia pseudomallei]CAJ2999056.1 Uncharacterised protein [Burkholderia pseudomallei]CAJ5549972.1 Uncharacterised protein [Burkholderia pseudomallei]CAJ5572885.1 Uncharacterised protein [Burkholderia pseudomallei]CAK1305272.1 Uncharacterised protein [Burkholderia pseudomallei]